jgi:hypothetical protein
LVFAAAVDLLPQGAFARAVLGAFVDAAKKIPHCLAWSFGIGLGTASAAFRQICVRTLARHSLLLSLANDLSESGIDMAFMKSRANLLKAAG